MMNMQAGIPKAQLMAGDAMNRALTRMAHEMMEQLMPLENVVLVGIRRRGCRWRSACRTSSRNTSMCAFRWAKWILPCTATTAIRRS